LTVAMTDRTRDGRPIEVVDNPGHGRFEAVVDGVVVGKAVYRVQAGPSGTVVFTHTEVDPGLQGQGVAQALARRALDQVRAGGRRVVPQCPFIAAYIGRHPEYTDLVVAP
jgi:predicted GNAT family acetyltransferase